MRDLGRVMQQRQAELRRLTAELQQTQTELLFTQVLFSIFKFEIL